MKNLTLKSLFLLLLLVSINAFSQNECKVLLPSISESYEGACKNGLAHGKGVAEGVDKYEGKFKNGFPEGRGSYYWKTGEYYVGIWKAGKREGKGKFHFKMNGADSVKYGYWEADRFVKNIPIKPYKVTRSTSVTRYNIRRLGDGNQVTISIKQNGAATKSYRNMSVVNSSGNYFNDGIKFGYDNLTFPFECALNYYLPTTLQTGTFEVDFNFTITQPGRWEVIIYN